MAEVTQESMDKALDKAFRDYFNTQTPDKGKKYREAYADKVRFIRDMDPELFKEHFQDKNTDQIIEALDKLAFSEKVLPMDEEIAAASEQRLTIPFGSEDDATLGGNTSLHGFAGFASPEADQYDEIMVAGGQPANVRDAKIRHETTHKLFDDETGLPEERTIRALDMLRSWVSNGAETTVALKDIRNIPSDSKPVADIWIALNAIPQMYASGMFETDDSTKEAAEFVMDKLDEDAQGFLDSILGNAPEKQPAVMKSLSILFDEQEVKDMLDLAPYAEPQTEGLTAPKYKVERANMAEGGLMSENKPQGSYNQAGITSFEMIPAFVTGTDEDVTDAALISRQYASEQGYDDQDRVEDTMRHVLLGGLVYGDPEGDRNLGNMAASELIDWREGDAPEDKNDLANNQYGRKLRELFPDREEFIQMVKILADGMYEGEEIPDIEGYTPKLSYGNSGMPTEPEMQLSTK